MRIVASKRRKNNGKKKQKKNNFLHKKIINKKKEFFYKKLMPKDFCQNGLCKILPDFSALRIGAPAEQFRNEVKE